MATRDFSLSFTKKKAFPEKVKSDSGEVFGINPSFRVILKILRLHADEGVLEAQKLTLTLQWFYGDVYPQDAHEAIRLFYDFAAGTHYKEEKKKSAPSFDYEFDAKEIYVSFLADYGIDLMETDMHWHQFKMLLSNLSSETPFAQKVRLRFLDLREYKGDQYTKAARAKREVQLPMKYSQKEAAAIAEMMAKLRG